jgi:dTDP-4-amino-4,6-dideoxygalactose transaminase
VTTWDAGLAATMRDICGRDDVMRNERAITSRMDEVQAAVLRVKLRHLDEWLQQRAEIASWYQNRLQPFGVTLAGPSLHHIFAIRVANRADLRENLSAKGIETKIHWGASLDEVAGPWNREGHFPGARRWAEQVLSLPMYPGLTASEVKVVCDACEAWLAANRITGESAGDGPQGIQEQQQSS